MKPLVLSLVVLALAPAAADAAPRKAKPCSARGSTTLDANRFARVYEVARDDDNHRIYGCLYRTRRRHLIASYFNCGCSRADETQPDVFLAGRHAAANQWGCDPTGAGGCAGSVVSYSLRTGGEVYRSTTGGPLSELVLGRSGAFAYLYNGQVRKADSSGAVTLDPGPGVEPGSLALSGGSRIYWTRDGQPFSASLGS